MDETVVFLILYVLIGSALVAVPHFIGLFVEASMGPSVSMFVFLGLFMTSLIAVFPIAVKLTLLNQDRA